MISKYSKYRSDYETKPFIVRGSYAEHLISQLKGVFEQAAYSFKCEFKECFDGETEIAVDSFHTQLFEAVRRTVMKFSDQESFDKRIIDDGPFDKRPPDDGPFDERPSDSGPFDKRPSGDGPFDKRTPDDGPVDERPSDSGPFDKRPSDDESFDGTKSDFEVNHRLADQQWPVSTP